MSDFRDHLAESIADEVFRDEWDAQAAERSVMREIVEACIEEGLSQRELVERCEMRPAFENQVICPGCQTKEFNMNPEKVRYAMSNDDLDARERADELIEAKESAVAARDSIFGKVISALLSSGRQEDVAELGSNPSLVERYAQELGIEF